MKPSTEKASEHSEDVKIVVEAMEEHGYIAGDGEDVAAWLGREIITETGVRSSEIMRQLAECTQIDRPDTPAITLLALNQPTTLRAHDKQCRRLGWLGNCTKLSP